MNKTYPKRNVETELVEQVKKAIGNIKWGSIEIFIQDSKVVQITERSIKKMQNDK